MKPCLICVTGMLLFSACSASPTSPTPTSGPASPAPTPGVPAPASPYALSGVVRVAGVPVAGAKVGLVKFGTPAPDAGPFVWVGGEEMIAAMVTDGRGSYDFPTVASVSFSGALVSASLPGYFTDTKYVPMSENRKLDFDLEPAAYISVGEVVQAQIGQSRCASFGYGGMGGALCRRFALTVLASGTLEVSVSTAPIQPVDFSVLRPDGTIAVYNASSSSPVRVSLPVATGLTYQIDVVHASAAARTFDLTTTLR